MISTISLLASVTLLAGNSTLEVSCPDEIEVTQTSLGVEGWSVGKTKARQILEGVEVFYGPIESGVQLVIPVWVEDNIEITQWKVAGSGVEVWLRCRYRDTTITLDKLLDPSILNCKQRPGTAKLEVSCK